MDVDVVFENFSGCGWMWMWFLKNFLDVDVVFENFSGCGCDFIRKKFRMWMCFLNEFQTI